MKHPLVKKIVAIALLTALLMIPLMMIESIVYERSAYRDQAHNSIAQSWTGAQQLVGPLLVVPYKEHYTLSVWDEEKKRYQQKKQTRHGRLLIMPEDLTIDGDITTETRKRGIYPVPVYHSRLGVSGRFAFEKIEAFMNSTQHEIEWQEAYLSVLISDVRGVETQPLLKWRDEVHEFLPDTPLDEVSNGMHVPLGRLESQREPLEFGFDLTLNGMEVLQFSPVGKRTSIGLSADWPDPSFIGRYLPTKREINAQGFTSKWNLSSFSSNISQHLAACQEGECSGLREERFGVRLFNSVDIYQQSERSVKYALMFIGLTFVSFFLFEVMKGLRLHPMQYLLVGLGLSVFYLLLISLSEHMAFHYAYVLATLASTLLIGFYISSVLRSLKAGAMITSALVVLYAMLYGILSSEDNSLLMGSLLVFAVLSLVMTVTRRLDWYAITDGLGEKITSCGEEKVSV
jgi:inner membrane protein